MGRIIGMISAWRCRRLRARLVRKFWGAMTLEAIERAERYIRYGELNEPPRRGRGRPRKGEC